jgi:hypothetical protein
MLITKRVDIGLTFAFSSVAIDLIDKPIGYAFVGTGRFLLHSIVIVAVIGAVLFIIFRNKLSIAFISGMLFHQVCDQMWLWMPIWLFPLMRNPFHNVPGGGYDFFTGLAMCCGWEMQTTELAFAIVSGILITVLVLSSRAPELKLRT